jgi:hypothetical protein
MVKIKIVQIAPASLEGDRHQYLDDKGRVWYDGGHTEKYDQKEGSYKIRWVTEWKQIELPGEPETEDLPF